MAFAAVISLKNTIERLLNSSHISLVQTSTEIIQLAYKELEPLQQVLERLDSSSKSSSRKRVNALDGRIREAVSTLEDALESHLSNQILSQSDQESSHPLLFSIDLEDLKQDIHSFNEKVADLKEEYIEELENPLPEEEEEEEDDETLSSRTDLGGKKSKLVGSLNQEFGIIDELTSPSEYDYNVISIVGMAGIGKTALAREMFEDPLVLSHFDCRAWVKVGRKYQLHEIAQSIQAQVDPDTSTRMLTEENDEKMSDQYLKEILKGRRCLIVLDDVWDTEVWDYLRSSFPYNNNGGSRILLTTRIDKVAHCETKYDAYMLMRLLDEEESWDLLCEKVFGEESCPFQLEKDGKKIAENCEGLPLMIVTVADLLSKAEKSLEFWNKTAEKKNSVFNDAYDEISKVLLPSYEYLPQHTKPCFLYLGVFPQNYDIPRSKLINMWIAEGFLEPNITETLEDCATKCLEELVSNNILMVCQGSTTYLSSKSCHRVKTCRLHSSFWNLCNREAGKYKFLHVLNRHTDGLEEDMKSQRRLCIHNNILLGIKDTFNSMEDDCASTARSLLCFGPYHQYQVPICLGLRLLRVLDALRIRIYDFPFEVLKLLQLRYLALTYNRKLPDSISKLWNLQFLIIHRHLSIKSYEAPLYVPTEIWNMQELKHIEIMGSNLPNPNCGTSLKNLSTLLGVSPRSCTKRVLKRVCNLKKLGIEIELVADDDSKPFRCLNRISRLRKLESLKCVIVNPELRSEVGAPPAPLSMFPSSLQKLHLSGLGYPWKYMTIIGSLPNLEMLKLRCLSRPEVGNRREWIPMA